MNKNPMEQQTELNMEQQSFISDKKMNNTWIMILVEMEQQCNSLAHTSIPISNSTIIK